MKRVRNTMTTVLLALALATCGGGDDGAADAPLDGAEADGPDPWADVPACSVALAHLYPSVTLDLPADLPADNACPAWWPAGAAVVDAMGADVLRFTFVPDGPAVTATFTNAPDLRDAALAVGDAVDAVAFVERCEVILNSALALWRPDGTPLLYAENDVGFSNSTEWRAACDAVHPCPSAALDATLGGGCALPDGVCSTHNRLLPVTVALAPGAVLSVDPGPAHAVTDGHATWLAAASGWRAGTAGSCTDFFGQGLGVVAARRP